MDTPITGCFNYWPQEEYVLKPHVLHTVPCPVKCRRFNQIF